MARALESRIVKLEKDDRGTGGNAFYLLWVAPGEDRVSALERARRQGKFNDVLPAYCAEWIGDGSRPRSRLTYPGYLFDNETKILFDALADDPRVQELAKSGDDVAAADEREREVQRRGAVELTNRELIGAVIGGLHDAHAGRCIVSERKTDRP
jgi:hypothetical protein